MTGYLASRSVVWQGEKGTDVICDGVGYISGPWLETFPFVFCHVGICHQCSRSASSGSKESYLAIVSFMQADSKTYTGRQ